MYAKNLKIAEDENAELKSQLERHRAEAEALAKTKVENEELKSQVERLHAEAEKLAQTKVMAQFFQEECNKVKQALRVESETSKNEVCAPFTGQET